MPINSRSGKLHCARTVSCRQDQRGRQQSAVFTINTIVASTTQGKNTLRTDVFGARRIAAEQEWCSGEPFSPVSSITEQYINRSAGLSAVYQLYTTFLNEPCRRIVERVHSARTLNSWLELNKNEARQLTWQTTKTGAKKSTFIIHV